MTETLPNLTDVAYAPRPDEVLMFEHSLRAAKKELTSVAHELKEPITAHRWDSVIGDDTSGRLVAIFIHRLMKQFARETGSPIPGLLFVSPLRSFFTGEEHNEASRKKLMADYLAARRDRLGERTLIVTEFISTGKSVEQISEALPDDVSCDIASPFVDKKFHNTLPGVELYFGALEDRTPNLYFALHGLAARHKSQQVPVSQRNTFNWNPKVVQGTRESTISLADEIYEEVFHGKEEK